MPVPGPPGNDKYAIIKRKLDRLLLKRRIADVIQAFKLGYQPFDVGAALGFETDHAFKALGSIGLGLV